MLLAMYQKLRLVREKNQLTLDLTKYTSKVERITKQIERAQKRYTSLFSQLESQAKMMQSQATVVFQNMSGLGTNSVDPFNYTGVNGFVYGAMSSALIDKEVAIGKDNDGNKIVANNIDKSLFNQMMTDYMNGKLNTPDKDADGNIIYADEEAKIARYGGGAYDEKQIKAFTNTMQNARMYQQQVQMDVQTKNQQYGNNISIWLEANKARLEAEQDAVLEPLNYEETMMELEKTQAETRLQRINAQIQSYDQLVSQEAQNSAPKFGLG